jgi:lysophospholipase L1-like esterase
MLTEEQIKLAIEIGSQQADKIIALRDQKLKTRATALAAKPQVARAIQTQEFKAKFVDKLGPTASHVLVAEGDSWFDYPFYDILKILEDDHGFDVESVSHKGDRVEDMAYSDGQLDEFTRRIEKLLRNGSVPPKAILLSGGGNDVAGDEFGMLLNHKASSVAGLNYNVVNGIINERIMSSYLTIIQRVTEICKSRVGNPLPILIHGYDYPVPDGRGYLGGWWFLPGPWFEPGFRVKGFGIIQERINIVKDLIDLFNEMLQTIASRPEFEHVHFVDVRKTLSTLPDKYQADWDNELHPTEQGFKAITAKFVQVINQL